MLSWDREPAASLVGARGWNADCGEPYREQYEAPPGGGTGEKPDSECDRAGSAIVCPRRAPVRRGAEPRGMGPVGGEATRRGSCPTLKGGEGGERKTANGLSGSSYLELGLPLRCLSSNRQRM
mgnify:CR=1 FL=1